MFWSQHLHRINPDVSLLGDLSQLWLHMSLNLLELNVQASIITLEFSPRCISCSLTFIKYVKIHSFPWESPHTQTHTHTSTHLHSQLRHQLDFDVFHIEINSSFTLYRISTTFFQLKHTYTHTQVRLFKHGRRVGSARTPPIVDLRYVKGVRCFDWDEPPPTSHICSWKVRLSLSMSSPPSDPSVLIRPSCLVFSLRSFSSFPLMGRGVGGGGERKTIGP